MRIEIGMLIKAARMLRQQADNTGPFLGFTFSNPEAHHSVTFDYCESEGLLALEEFAQVLTEVIQEEAEL